MTITNPPVNFMPVDRLQYETPTEGQTINIAGTSTLVILAPAAARGTVTINLPTTSQAANGMITLGVSGKSIAGTTWGGTATILGGPTGVLANGFCSFMFRTDTWYRAG